MRLEMKMQMSAGAAAEREKAAAAIERISLSLSLLHFDPNPIEAPTSFLPNQSAPVARPTVPSKTWPRLSSSSFPVQVAPKKEDPSEYFT